MTRYTLSRLCLGPNTQRAHWCFGRPNRTESLSALISAKHMRWRFARVTPSIMWQSVQHKSSTWQRPLWCRLGSLAGTGEEVVHKHQQVTCPMKQRP